MEFPPYSVSQPMWLMLDATPARLAVSQRALIFRVPSFRHHTGATKGVARRFGQRILE
jgi:hypothetical protein